MSTMIALTDGTTTLALSGDMDWPDEYDWHPVVAEHTYTTTGALVIDHGLRQAGRPITLRCGENFAWVTRAACDQLRAWAAMPGLTLSLTLRGATRTVAFDHAGGPAFEARQVMQLGVESVTADDYYAITIKLIEI